ncbi:MAG: VWA domain-containing protein, partial [Thermoplasmata archaeon]
MNSGRVTEPSFIPRLAGFVAFLRLRGFAVGTGAALDCTTALRQISLLDRSTFLAACIATLAKSPEDVARLTESFDLYWRTYIEPADSQTRLAVSAPPSPPPDGLASQAEAAPAMRIAVDRAGVVRVGLYSHDAPSAGHIIRPLERKRVLAIRAGVRRLRRHVATRPGRRQSPARRGAIDFSATARHSLRQGGEWVDFRYETPRKRRAELVVLWDVSGSMRD